MNNLINSQITIAHAGALIGVIAVVWIIVSCVKTIHALKADVKGLKETAASESDDRTNQSWKNAIAKSVADSVSRVEDVSRLNKESISHLEKVFDGFGKGVDALETRFERLEGIVATNNIDLDKKLREHVDTTLVAIDQVEEELLKLGEATDKQLKNKSDKSITDPNYHWPDKHDGSIAAGPYPVEDGLHVVSSDTDRQSVSTGGQVPSRKATYETLKKGSQELQSKLEASNALYNSLYKMIKADSDGGGVGLSTIHLTRALADNNENNGGKSFDLVSTILHHMADDGEITKNLYEHQYVWGLPDEKKEPSVEVIPPDPTQKGIWIQNLLLAHLNNHQIIGRISTKELGKALNEKLGIIRPILKNMASAGTITQDLVDNQYFWGLPKAKYELYEPLETNAVLHEEILKSLGDYRHRPCKSTNQIWRELRDKFAVATPADIPGTRFLSSDAVWDALLVLLAADKVEKAYDTDKQDLVEWRLRKEPEKKPIPSTSEKIEKRIVERTAGWIRASTVKAQLIVDFHSLPEYRTLPDFNETIAGMIYEGKLFAEYRTNPIEVGFSLEDKSLWIKATKKVEDKSKSWQSLMSELPPTTASDLFEKYKSNLEKWSKKNEKPDLDFMIKIEGGSSKEYTIDKRRYLLNMLRTYPKFACQPNAVLDLNSAIGNPSRGWGGIAHNCNTLATAEVKPPITASDLFEKYRKELSLYINFGPSEADMEFITKIEKEIPKAIGDGYGMALKRQIMMTDKPKYHEIHNLSSPSWYNIKLACDKLATA